MVTAKIGGNTSPWTKRQKISADSVGASAAISVGTASTDERGDDHALPAEHVGDGAGERRGQRDGERARGHDGGDLGGAGAEFVRQQRQDRLRRIEIEEGAIAGEPDRQPAREVIAVFGGWHQVSRRRKRRSYAVFTPRPRGQGA